MRVNHISAYSGVIGLLAAGSVSAQTYTQIIDPIQYPNWPLEPSHKDILQGRYSGTFTASGVNFSNGTITAIRVPDRLPGASNSGAGLPIYLGIPADGSQSLDQTTDQVWQNAFDTPRFSAVFATYDQQFGYFAGSGDESQSELTRLFSLPGGSYYNFEPLQLQTGIPNSMLRWGRAGGPPRRLSYLPSDRLFSSREADNPDNPTDPVRHGDHLVTYKINDPTKPSDLKWMLFWEDLLPNQPSDFDYNDLVVEIEVVPQRWINPSNGVWNSTANWGTGVVPNSESAVANFLEDITTDATITLNTPNITVNRVRLASSRIYTFVGGPMNNALTLTPVDFEMEILVERGSHTFNSNIGVAGGNSNSINLNVLRQEDVLRFNGNFILNSPPPTFHKLGAGFVEMKAPQVSGALNLVVDAGTLRFTSDFTSSSGPLTIAKFGVGLVEVKKLQSSTSPLGLDIRGGTLRLIAGAPAGVASRVNAVNLTTLAGAKLDITNNALVVDYASGPSPLNTIKGLISSAYHGGAWDGNGIGSTLANANQFAVGYGENDGMAGNLNYTMFLGEPVDQSSVLLRFTRYGDADLNGLVNLMDFNRLAMNFGLSGGWSQGDFDYNGTVNLRDFNLLAGNFGLTAGPDGPTPEDWAALAAVVPEPGGVLSGFVVVPLLQRRRRIMAWSRVSG